MKNNITQLIIDVIDMVKNVPEKFQKSSFEVLLSHFLTQSTLDSKPHGKKQTIHKHTETDVLQVMLNTNYDWAFTGIKKLNGITQYLKILDVAQKFFKIDTLSASNIKIILEQKFREKKTVNTISMSLMESVGKYVDRIKEDKGYRYSITISGEERLEQIFGGNKN